MTREMKPCGSRVVVPVVGAFADMSSDVDALADITASALAADLIQFFSTSSVDPDVYPTAGLAAMHRSNVTWVYEAVCNINGVPPLQRLEL